jgi:hypothetical protein
MQSKPGFEKVVASSGHLIDKPDRPKPRFPPEKEAVVRDHIAQALADWQIGESDLGLSGGARGADILFAECCLERGARVRLLIALPEQEFLDQSVRLNGGNWEERYFALRNHPNVETLFQHERGGPPAGGLSPFETNNIWMIEMAREEAGPGKLYAVLVWDEQPSGDGPGGTSHFAKEIERLGGEVHIVNPTKLSPQGGD